MERNAMDDGNKNFSPVLLTLAAGSKRSSPTKAVFSNSTPERKTGLSGEAKNELGDSRKFKAQHLPV